MIFLQTPKKTYMIFPSIPRISHDFSIPSPKPPENYHGFPCSQDLVTLHRQLLAAERSAEHSDTPSLCRDGHWMGASVAMLAAETWFRLSQNKNPIPQLLRIAQLGLRNSLVGLRNYRIAQLGLRNSQDCATPLAQLSGLRNSDCATHRIAQLCLRDCFWQIAQLPGLCNSACATTIARLRNSATTLRPNNSSSHRIWKWRAPSTRARCYQNSHPELQTDLESPQG